MKRRVEAVRQRQKSVNEMIGITADCCYQPDAFPRVLFPPEWLRAAVLLEAEWVCKLPGQLVKIHALTEVSMRLNILGVWVLPGDAVDSKGF